MCHLIKLYVSQPCNLKDHPPTKSISYGALDCGEGGCTNTVIELFAQACSSECSACKTVMKMWKNGIDACGITELVGTGLSEVKDIEPSMLRRLDDMKEHLDEHSGYTRKMLKEMKDENGLRKCPVDPLDLKPPAA